MPNESKKEYKERIRKELIIKYEGLFKKSKIPKDPVEMADSSPPRNCNICCV